MTATAIEQELLDQEEQFWRAIRDKDTDAALRLTDEPSIVTGAQGVASLDHATFRKMAEDETWTLHDFEISDTQVRMLTDDVGVVAYMVKEKMTVEGKPLELTAAEASTWVRRDGRWVCALHAESIKGDPFGRDKAGGGAKR